MEGPNTKSRFNTQILAILVVCVVVQNLSTANGQSISTPCTTAMLNSFTPCMNYITGSSSNGTSPTVDCCNSLKAITAASMDCVCLLVTASVPLPNMNRALAISLPKACRASGVSGVPVQCQATGSPLPAPGPALLGSPSPSAFSPQASDAEAIAPTAIAPAAITPETPAFPPSDVEAPSTPARIRPVLTPSASIRSYTALSPVALMIIFMGFIGLKM